MTDVRGACGMWGKKIFGRDRAIQVSPKQNVRHSCRHSVEYILGRLQISPREASIESSLRSSSFKHSTINAAMRTEYPRDLSKTISPRVIIRTESLQSTSQDLPNDSVAATAETYDYICVELWKATMKKCARRLEPQDLEHALKVKTLRDLHNEVHELEKQYFAGTSQQITILLYSILEHYEQFTQSFVHMVSNKVEGPMLWGLLFLVITLSLEFNGTIDRVAKMLEEIGHQLQRLHQCALAMPSGYVRVMDDTVKVHQEIITLWVNVIGIFRDLNNDREPAQAFGKLTTIYEQALRTIGDAVLRVEYLAQMGERQTRMLDHTIFGKHLERYEAGGSRKGQLPCFMLPFAQNRKFFGHEMDLRQIESHLQPASDGSGLRSVALWGMGGIGKTQCALAYGYSQRERIDAVFWVTAETELSIRQSFSRIAHQELQLPGTTQDTSAENAVHFQNWLTNTTAKWLLIFDNVEDHRLLANNWPVAYRGTILITTRRPSVATLPVDTGIELKVLSASESVNMLHNFIGRKTESVTEQDAALQLSRLLNGYPLAINQMAAYIVSKRMRIATFVELYLKYPQKMRTEKKAGWKYIGYDHAQDTVWALSFDNLTNNARALLSTLSFCDPDSIPLQLLSAGVAHETLKDIGYLEDDFTLWESIESATDSALVRNDPDSGCLSLHRLVRAEALFRSTANQRQKAFDTAIKLLRVDFPARELSAPRLDRWQIGAKYLPHIVTLANDWHDSQRRLEPLKASSDLCELMCDASFFVQDNDPAAVLSLSANVAGEALEMLPMEQRSGPLEASVYETLSFHDLKEGAFHSAGQLARKALNTRLQLVNSRSIYMVTSYNLVALALDSEGRYDEAEEWWNKAVSLTDGKSDEQALRLSCRDNLNFSRNRYCTRNFAAAKERIDLSLAAARTFEQNWHVDAFICQTSASLYSRSGNFAKAKYYSDLAQEVLDAAGGEATTSWIAYLCAHRTAQVAILQNRSADAIEAAVKATTMGRLYKVTTSMLARSTHVLYCAYSLDKSYEAEAEKAKREAQRLRGLLPPGRTNLADDSDEAYESIVDIIQR